MLIKHAAEGPVKRQLFEILRGLVSLETDAVIGYQKALDSALIETYVVPLSLIAIL